MPLSETTPMSVARTPRGSRKASSGLKITLKPFERIEIGGLTLINGWTESSTFSIEGTAPVLRQANTILEDHADTSLRQVYLRLQKLYLRRDGATLEGYHQAVERLLEEMPAAAEAVEKANKAIADQRLYAALKAYRDLLDQTDEGWSSQASEPAPIRQGDPEALPRVEFVRDRRKYRAGASRSQPG
uniref:Flagellar FlbT family protein n=1 Tax=Rhodopseudomonas palustris (strain DX-1) TaxID=652103 RepID=E6VEN1_RHOPX